jgi:hypothetical protein
MENRKCESILYAEGEEHKCAQPATAIVDNGTDSSFLVCAECMRYCHVSRNDAIDKRGEEQ